jgi:hypothetical protein
MVSKKLKPMKKRNSPSIVTLPQFCDYACPHAHFPPADAVGACRREQAVYCSLLKKFNNRNNKCIAKS